MRNVIVCALCAAALLPAAARAEEIGLELDPAQTEIRFTLADVLHTVHGVFALKSGSMRFDAAAGKAGGSIVIDVRSGSSGNATRDRKMHKDVLESAQFPEAVFTPDRIDGQFVPGGMSDLDVHGLFQLHGAVRELSLHAHVEAKGERVTATLRAELLYTQWGVRNPSTLFLRVSDKVQLEIQTSATLTEGKR